MSDKVKTVIENTLGSIYDDYLLSDKVSVPRETFNTVVKLYRAALSDMCKGCGTCAHRKKYERLTHSYYCEEGYSYYDTGCECDGWAWRALNTQEDD